MAKSLERAQADYDLEMYSSYVDGKTEGKAEGDTERQLKTAIAMIGKGFQPDVVAECTELSLDRVMALCQ